MSEATSIPVRYLNSKMVTVRARIFKAKLLGMRKLARPAPGLGKLNLNPKSAFGNVSVFESSSNLKKQNQSIVLYWIDRDRIGTS